MAHIICGHCRDLHETVDEVRECASVEYAPVDVSCFSCDGFIRWADAGEDVPDGIPAGCGGPGICQRDFLDSFGTV